MSKIVEVMAVLKFASDHFKSRIVGVQNIGIEEKLSTYRVNELDRKTGAISVQGIAKITIQHGNSEITIAEN